MRKPKNYQYYVAVGKLLKKALNLIKHHNVQIDILCQLLCDNDLEEDKATEEEIVAYMDSKDKNPGCTFEEWKKTQLGIPWDWEQGGY